MINKFLIFSFLLLLLPIASAECLDIRAAKSSYLAGETFQAEITGTLTKQLSYTDISFYYAGKEYFPVFSIERIAANKWIVYFDLLPRYGINTFAVKSICRENETLREMNKSASFAIKKPLQDYYSSLADKVKGKWALFSSDEISRALIALDGFADDEILNNGKQALLAKGAECWPSENCTVKSTVLAMLAVNTTEKNWLADSQNSVDLGLWDLIVNSDSDKKCNLTINGETEEIELKTGVNSIDLDLSDTEIISVSLGCNLAAKISHTYLGNVHEFSLGNISNEKCWGNSYRSKCNATSTAYALKIIQDSKAESWLYANAKTTEDIALIYSYTQDSSFREWLINNQHPSGYWGSEALAISNTSNVYATVASATAMEDAKAGSWLRDNLDSFNLEEQAFALDFFADKIEPLVAIKQGSVQANSLENSTIRVSNKGFLPVVLTAKILDSSQSITIPAKTVIPFDLKMPKVEELTFASVDISYSLGAVERGYSIPAIIFPSEEEKQETNLFNQTVEEAAIKTNFEFVEDEINKTLNPGEEYETNITIKNLASESAIVDLTIYGNIAGVIQHMPFSATLEPNSLTTITITLKAPYASNFSGQINAESKGSSDSVLVYINAEEIVSGNSCSELNGTICKSGEECKGSFAIATDGTCCFVKCSKIGAQKPKTNLMQILGIAMVAVAVIAALLFLFFKLRKRKKPALEKVLEKIKEESMSPERKI